MIYTLEWKNMSSKCSKQIENILNYTVKFGEILETDR